MSKRVILLVLVLIASMVMLHATNTWTVTGRVGCTCGIGIPNVQIDLLVGDQKGPNLIIAMAFTDDQGYYEHTINKDEFLPKNTFWVREVSPAGRTGAIQITHDNLVVDFPRIIVRCKGIMEIIWPPIELPIPPPKIKF